jgi:hypothetical protein
LKGKALGSLSDFAENALLQHIFNTAYTPAATVYVALCTADPTDAATGASMSEVANANGYARTAVTFGAAALRKVVQSGAVTFPQASGTWGTIAFWAIVDSPTYGAGNVLASGAFTASFAPVAGNTPTIPSGELQVQMNASSGAGFVDATVHKLFDRMFRNQAYAKPATYVGLATATVADTAALLSDITEVSGGAYARVQVNINGGASPTWSVASGGALNNLAAITFPTPSGSWGLVTSCFLIDSASGAGNVIGYDNANIVDQTPVANDTVQFAIGAFAVSLS